MAFVHGKSSVFKLDNASGSLTDISAFVNNVDAILGAVVGQTATLSYEYSPEGTASGKVKYTGEAILTNYALSSPVGDVVAYSADLQCSGAVTRGTH